MKERGEKNKGGEEMKRSFCFFILFVRNQLHFFKAFFLIVIY